MRVFLALNNWIFRTEQRLVCSDRFICKSCKSEHKKRLSYMTCKFTRIHLVLKKVTRIHLVLKKDISFFLEDSVKTQNKTKKI